MLQCLCVFEVWVLPVFTGPVCIQGLACLYWACMYIQGMVCLHWACMYSGFGLSLLGLYVFRVWSGFTGLYVFRVWPVFTGPVCIQGMACVYSGYGLSSLGLQQGSLGRGEAAGGEQRLSQPHGVQGGQVSTSL